MSHDIGPKEIMEFLSTPDRPVKAGEFMIFWKNCSDEEKEDYRTTILEMR